MMTRMKDRSRLAFSTVKIVYPGSFYVLNLYNQTSCTLGI